LDGVFGGSLFLGLSDIEVVAGFRHILNSKPQSQNGKSQLQCLNSTPRDTCKVSPVYNQ